MNIVLICAGDHGMETLNYLNDIQHAKKNIFQNIYIFDKNLKKGKLFKKINKNIILINSIKKIPKNLKIKANITAGDPLVRENAYMQLKKQNIDLFTIIHPTSYVAKTALIKKGAVIGPKSVIAPFSIIEDNVLINSAAIVGHHSKIGKNSVLSPNSFTGGHAKVGKCAFLGASSCIMPNTKMGNYSKLSACSVLYKNINNYYLAHGNPAKEKKMYIGSKK